MDLIKELEQLVIHFNLKQRTIEGLNSFLENHSAIELDLKDKKKVEYEFYSSSLILKENGLKILRVRLNLLELNMIIGYYDFETSFDGEFYDEFFVIH